MKLTNQQVSSILREVAQYRGLARSRWGQRAYEKAADLVDQLSIPAHQADKDVLCKLPGIGAKLASVIVSTAQGQIPPELAELRAKWPPSIFTLTRIVGVGAKRAVKIWETYRTPSFDDLYARVQGGSIDDPALCKAVISAYQMTGKRLAWAEADGIIRHILAALDCGEGILARAVGSYRRQAESVGDVDIIFATKYPARRARIIERFRSLGSKIVSGESKNSIYYSLPGGSLVRVDLLTVHPSEWGAALLYFTGSAAHNVALRSLALARGLTLNEKGLWRIKSGKLIAARTEHAIYEALGLRYTSPPNRTGKLRKRSQ